MLNLMTDRHAVIHLAKIVVGLSVMLAVPALGWIDDVGAVIAWIVASLLLMVGLSDRPMA